MKKQLLLSLALFSISSVSLAASLTSMSSTEAKNALSDKTITTVSEVTLNGDLIDNTFTGYVNKDGTVTGKLANSSSNNPQTDQGTWKVKDDGKFCFTWQKWDNGQEKCVTFYKLSNAILVVGSGNKFETLILDSNIKSGNHM